MTHSRTLPNFFGKPTLPDSVSVVVRDNNAIQIVTLVVHKFYISPELDTVIAASGGLAAWSKTEIGQWVIKRAVDVPVWHILPAHYDDYSFKTCVAITARLSEQDATFFKLKWGKI